MNQNFYLFYLSNILIHLNHNFLNYFLILVLLFYHHHLYLYDQIFIILHFLLYVFFYLQGLYWISDSLLYQIHLYLSYLIIPCYMRRFLCLVSDCITDENNQLIIQFVQYHFYLYQVLKIFQLLLTFQFVWYFYKLWDFLCRWSDYLIFFQPECFSILCYYSILN